MPKPNGHSVTDHLPFTDEKGEDMIWSCMKCQGISFQLRNVGLISCEGCGAVIGDKRWIDSKPIETPPTDGG